MHESLLNTRIWYKLYYHSQSIENLSLRDMFRDHPQRGKELVIQDKGVYFDFSKHRITQDTIRLFKELAQKRGVEEKRDKMFAGEKINTTEDRAVLHTALRSLPKDDLEVEGQNVVPDVQNVLRQMQTIAERIRSQQWKGYTGKPIRHIINIGIGGSDLGPAMAYKALRAWRDPGITCHFVSNIDGADIASTLEHVDPEETLVIVASKTFTTMETMTNAHTARQWFVDSLGDQEAVADHFLAISTHREAVQEFGIHPEYMVGFWDWVGGRYSLDSAIGLSLMIAIGADAFFDMLEGFRDIDDHFQQAPLEENIPVMMGMLTVWYSTMWNLETQAVLPYSHDLARFPAYLQQLMMESNGKRVTVDGQEVSFSTGPIIWGEPGTNGQHSFYQLLHQGTHTIPCDFIGFRTPQHSYTSHHQILLANMIAQGQALAFGKSEGQVLEEGVSESLAPHKTFPGDNPSSTLLLDQLTPQSLGKLIALYEHSVFVQGVVWGINSFDQMGVELGKDLAKKIIPELSSNQDLSHYDSSTQELIKQCRSA